MEETGKKTRHQIWTNPGARSDSFIKQLQGISVYQLFTLKVCDLANVRRLISGVGSRGCIKQPKVSVLSHLLLNEHNVFLSCFKLCFCAVCYLKDLSDQLNPH